MVFSGKINQAQSVSDDLIESQNLRIFYAMLVFFSIRLKRSSEKPVLEDFQTTFLYSDTLNPLSPQYDRIRGQSPRYNVYRLLTVLNDYFAENGIRTA